jgi:integrase
MKMLIKNHVEQLIQIRPYKYATKQTLIRDVKKLGIWDMEIEDVTSAHILNVVEQIPNHNSRRRLYITARTIFRDLNKCQDLPTLDTIPREYIFPNQEDIEWMIDKSKYCSPITVVHVRRFKGWRSLCNYPVKIRWQLLKIDQAWSQDGMFLGSPKTYGRVLLPEWLVREVKNMKPEQYWKKGMTTKLVTGSAYKISRMKSAVDKTGGIHLNPHLLRHWFATWIKRDKS